MFNSKNKWLLCIFVVLGGCKDDPVDFPVEPKIEIVSLTPVTAQQYTDHLVLSIRYEDGDGDLGENNELVKNCFVTDNRTGTTSSFRIEQLAPTGASIPITGLVNIGLGGQIITDNSAQQSATFSVYVVDRSGHQSNTSNATVTIIR